MFRKGGNVGNGIMSGITDRVQKPKEGFLPGSTAVFQGAMGVTEEGIDFGRTRTSETPFRSMESPALNIVEMVGTA